jgi:hypothetical protein
MLVVALLLGILVLALVGCASPAEPPSLVPPSSAPPDEEPPSPAPPDEDPVPGVDPLPPSDREPQQGAAPPIWRDPIDIFKERCARATSDLDVAAVYFDATPDMRLNEPAEYRLVIQPVELKAPPGPGSQDELGSQGKLGVTCTIDARLAVSPDAASVNPTDWEQQRYLPPAPAEWTWHVTPKRGGEFSASLQVRPVVRITNEESVSTLEHYSTETYSVTVSVQQSMMDWIRALTSWGQALLAFVAVVSASLGFLGVRKWWPVLWGKLRRETA